MTYPYTLTATFSECVENHVGMQQIGRLAEHGFTNERLAEVHAALGAVGIPSELHNLARQLPEGRRADNAAYLLMIPQGARAFGVDPDAMLAEIAAVPHDTKMWSDKHGGVVNKKARHNICIADAEQAPDFANKRGTVASFARLPETAKMRAAIGQHLGAQNLYAETNLYYDVSKCGIGYHGDTERKIIVGVRLGAPMPLVYQWYERSQAVGGAEKFTPGHGDIYVMSEKAGGSDWRRPSILTLRHAAGARAYTGVD